MFSFETIDLEHINALSVSIPETIEDKGLLPTNILCLWLQIGVNGRSAMFAVTPGRGVFEAILPPVSPTVFQGIPFGRGRRGPAVGNLYLCRRTIILLRRQARVRAWESLSALFWRFRYVPIFLSDFYFYFLLIYSLL